MKQLPGVALHEFVQRRTVAGREADHIRPVTFVTLCSIIAHGLIFTEKLMMPLQCGSSEWIKARPACL